MYDSSHESLTTPIIACERQGLTTWAATILIVGELAGVGILALTDAAVKSGLSSFVLLPFFCILSAYTAHLLCECWSIVRLLYPEYSGHVPNPYPVIGLKTYGRVGQFVVTASINLTLFGASVVFIVLAAQLIDGIFTSWNFTGVTFCLWMIIITAILLPLSWLGTPKDFWWIAVFAMLATAIACVLVVVNTIRAAPLVPDWAKWPPKTNAQDIFMALGTIMFAFSGHPGFPTIAIDMKQPEKFTKSSFVAYCIVLSTYLPVVVLGYLTFGGDVDDNIMLTLNRYLERDVANTAIEALIFVHVISAFTIVLNPVLQHAEELFHIPNEMSWKRVLVRSALVLFGLFCAESIPRFGVLVSLVGSSTNAMLVYVIPCTCYLKLKRTVAQVVKSDSPELVNGSSISATRYSLPIPLWERALLYIVIAIGLFAVVSGTITSVMSIVGQNTFVAPCYVNFEVTP